MSDIPSTLAQPAQRALQGAGISKLEDLTKFTKRQVADLHGMGPNALKKLEEAMKSSGVEFAAKK